MELFKNTPELERKFRQNKKQTFAATEIAYIFRYLNGDKTITKEDFSSENLEIVKKLISKP